MRHRRTTILRAIGVTALVVALTNSVATGYARPHADDFESQHLKLSLVINNLKEPTHVVGPPDGSNRLFVLERAGLVRVADPNGQVRPTPFLDLRKQVSLGAEQGLLGLAFHPAFAQNGYVYVDYTAKDWSVQVIRYRVSPEHPNVVDPATAQVVLAVPKQSKYHNGGMLAFGPDGYLYVSLGDDEVSESAQDLGTLFGKILRLDVDSTEPYAVPPSNPFANRAEARGEIWSYGLRNPWRLSFDRATGDLWIGDVGDAMWEEVDFQPASSRGGENYGWPMYEGFQCMQADQCDVDGLVAPLVTYGHNMNCCVIGGYVYRGASAPELIGTYLFGDLCTGGVFALDGSADQGWTRLELGYQPIKISSFGEDPAGEVYVVDIQGGAMYKVAGGSLPPPKPVAAP
jgi:glucose/arabinose dehydrogenase